MKKITIILIILNCYAGLSSAQVSGPDSVCSGYLYNYTANIPGADSISWTLPTGWHIISTFGLQAEVLCNQTVGQICADGYDSLGNHLSHICKSVSWGGGGGGWDVQAVAVTPCQCPNFDVQIIPNSSTQCGSCSAGTISPNLRYAVYDGPWPTGIFQMYAGVTTMSSPMAFTTYYVYLVDITFGIANAIRIDGGLCPATVNNTFFLGPCWYTNLQIVQTPDPVCIGDTMTLQYNQSSGPFNTFYWNVLNGNATLMSPTNLDHVQCIINTNATVDIELLCTDILGCPYSGFMNPNFIVCNQPPPVASFQASDSDICEGSCINYINTSTNATSYHWLFPGGNPSIDTSANPHNICYSNFGTYGARLVATNSNGSDTMMLNNFLTVHPQVSFSPLTQNGDTLFCTPGLSNYQWYLDTMIIPGATDFYYVAMQSGDYSVEISDSNGCTALAKLLGVVATVNNPNSSLNGFMAKYLNGNIYLNLTSEISSIATVELTDAFGKDIFIKNIFTITGKNEIELPGVNLSSGIYIIRIYNSKETMTKKIFIQK